MWHVENDVKNLDIILDFCFSMSKEPKWVSVIPFKGLLVKAAQLNGAFM